MSEEQRPACIRIRRPDAFRTAARPMSREELEALYPPGKIVNDPNRGLLSPSLISREALGMLDRELTLGRWLWSATPPPARPLTWRERARDVVYEARYRLRRAWDALCGRYEEDEWD